MSNGRKIRRSYANFLERPWAASALWKVALVAIGTSSGAGGAARSLPAGADAMGCGDGRPIYNLLRVFDRTRSAGLQG
jgi:hypothetical protein